MTRSGILSALWCTGLLLAACVDRDGRPPTTPADIVVVCTERVAADPDLLAEVSRAFYARYPDEFDILCLWSGPAFAPGHAFYQPVSNDVPGIGYEYDGREFFDDSARYGSAGRLQGIIWMGPDWLTNPDSAGGPRSVLGIFAQETAHRWGCFLRYESPDSKTPSDQLLGLPGHWSFFLDTGFSPLEGNNWQSLNDRMHQASPADRVRFCPLDLYLMGLLPPEEVGSIRLLTNPRRVGGTEPASFTAYAKRTQQAMTIEADIVHITMDQIMAVHGRRDPTVGFSAHRIRQAWILVLPDAPPSAFDLVERLEALRLAWPDYFSEATGGRGAVVAGLTPEY